MNRADVGMIQDGRGLRFTAETCECTVGLGLLLRVELESNVVALRHRVVGVGVDDRPAALERSDHVAGREQVRLDDVVDLRGSFGAVAGNLIVATVRGSHRLHGADSNHVRVITGRGDGAVPVCALRVVTASVAG